MRLEELKEGIILLGHSVHFVVFSHKVVNRLEKYIQIAPGSFEAGGFLIGVRKDNHFKITDITEPYRKDIRKRNYFERNDDKHIKKLNLIKIFSHCQNTFLGEWHTHPELMPQPSNLDISEWKKTIRNNNEALLFLIIGQQDIYINTSDCLES